MARFTPPADGEFILGVYDFTYTGGAEHPYRLVIHDHPHVHEVFPPAIEPGKKARIAFSGVHLDPQHQQIEIQAPQSPTPPDRPHQLSDAGFSYIHPGSGQSLRLALATAPVVIKQSKDQVLPIPSELAGRFDGQDQFLFDAKKEQPVVIEVFCHRMGHAADPVLIVEKVLPNDKGETSYAFITEQDDTKSEVGGTRHVTSHRDPVYTLKPDADARYRITVQNRFGTPAVYRLAVRPATPDFHLFTINDVPGLDQKKAEPWSPVTLNQGGGSHHGRDCSPRWLQCACIPERRRPSARHHLCPGHDRSRR